jgi:hypothetical protein
MTLWVLGPAVTAGLGRRSEPLTPTYPAGTLNGIAHLGELASELTPEAHAAVPPLMARLEAADVPMRKG